MARIAALSVADVESLRRKVETGLKDCSSVQAAAQKFVEILFDELSESAVLFRVFSTVALGALPARDQSFARELARERRSDEELDEKTTVVALLGTRGKRAGWNDRYNSERHLAVPLTRASFIKTIPMLARLMSDMGTGLDWVEKQGLHMVVRSVGQMARVLYVEDARKAVTSDGFMIVSDQDFVVQHGVKTVIALGGAYLDRTVVGIVLFTRELIPQDRVEKMLPLVHAFKTATMKDVMQARIFG
jgi:hypothetical protein